MHYLRHAAYGSHVKKNISQKGSLKLSKTTPSPIIDKDIPSLELYRFAQLKHSTFTSNEFLLYGSQGTRQKKT